MCQCFPDLNAQRDHLESLINIQIPWFCLRQLYFNNLGWTELVYKATQMNARGEEKPVFRLVNKRKTLKVLEKINEMLREECF